MRVSELIKQLGDLNPDEVDEVEELLGYEEDAHDDLGYEVYGDE